MNPNESSGQNGAEAPRAPEEEVATQARDAAPGAFTPHAHEAVAEPTLAQRLVQAFTQAGTLSGDSAALAPLREAFDHVLVRRFGVSRQIVCIVDCAGGDERTCPLDREELLAVAKRYHSEEHLGALRALHVCVYEVGRPQSLQDDHARLASLKKRGGQLFLSAWTLDAEAPLWTNAPFGGMGYGREQLERLFATAGGPGAPRLLGAKRFPAVTLGLLLAIGAVFVWQMAQAGWSTDFKPQQLVADGGVMRSLVVARHEWWRLFTAPLLHAGTMHILLNSIALGLVGYFLEQLLGRAWLFALFVIGALGGSLLSVLVNPAHVVSVGASGAIMALFAAGMVIAMRLPAGAARTRLQIRLGEVLVPSLLPMASQAAEVGKIDYGAHFGGAIAGVVVGFILYKSWPREQSQPPAQVLARGVSVFGVGLFALGLLLAHHAAPHYELAEELAPHSALPTTTAEWHAREDALIAKYPHDPRLRLMRAAHEIDSGKSTAAEHDARTALREKELLADYFKPELALRLDAMLGLALQGEGRRDEARAATRPACASSSPAGLLHILRARRLCD